MQRTDSSEAKIQIVQTKKQPLLDIISGFYTTLVVNVLSWNKAYALYPQPSFLYHSTYLLRGMSDCYGKLLAKYDERGWPSHDVLWPEDEASHGSMAIVSRGQFHSMTKVLIAQKRPTRCSSTRVGICPKGIMFKGRDQITICPSITHLRSALVH